MDRTQNIVKHGSNSETFAIIVLLTGRDESRLTPRVIGTYSVAVFMLPSLPHELPIYYIYLTYKQLL